ncbi:methylated-DNA--[protein]-cysteine S-methyltransferase [Chloroflexota bacterium]
MTQQLHYITFNTEIGWIGILSSANGLLRTTLPQRSDQEARQLLGNNVSYANWSPHLFKDLIERLQAYFNGYRTTFTDEIDLSRATHFQREVWKITRHIPYSETRSYSWVAKQIKKPQAVRAVGQALSKNPLPIIIPCHRVIANDAKLSGFGGGVEMKRHLLSLEAEANIR